MELRPLQRVDPGETIIDGHMHLIGDYADPAKLLSSMDRNGIQKGLLFASPTKTIGPRTPKLYLKTVNNTVIGKLILEFFQQSPGFADLMVPQPDNLAVFQMISQHHDRLCGLVFINPNLPTATEELQKGIEQYGMSGIKMHLFAFPISLADKRLIPIMEYAAARALPVLIDLGIDEEIAAPVFDLAKNFPRAPIIIPHLGGMLFDLTMNNAARFANVYLDTSGYTVTLDRAVKAFKTVGAERLIFGSDGPPDLGGDPLDSLDIIANMKITNRELELILSGNLASLVNWD